MEVTINGQLKQWTPTKYETWSPGEKTLAVTGADADGRTAVTLSYRQGPYVTGWGELQLYQVEAKVNGQVVPVTLASHTISYDAASKRLRGRFATGAQSTLRIENGSFDLQQ
ncbi:hypothetical protein [Hymenobacter edaphi]|nr:hypothetical protein [Hymenobacter edaphi]